MGEKNKGIEILDERIVRTENEIALMYPHCMYIIVDINMNNLNDRRCKLYAVSHSPESYEELGKELIKLRKRGIANRALSGDYE